MKLPEKETFEAWRAGSVPSLPVIDWVANRGPEPSSPRGLKVATRRAEALNRLYETDRAQPCHAVWFAQEQPLWLPLVQAISRIIGAEGDAAGGRVRSSLEHSEDCETLAKVVKITLPILRRSEDGEMRTVVNRQISFLNQKMISLQRKAEDSTRTGKRKRHQDIPLRNIPLDGQVSQS